MLPSTWLRNSSDCGDQYGAAAAAGWVRSASLDTGNVLWVELELGGCSGAAHQLKAGSPCSACGSAAASWGATPVVLA
jgi:hypothetical protein